MSVLSDFNALVASRVPETDAIMDTTERDAAVAQAVAFWSKHRPQVLVADIAGSGVFDLTLPADYDLTLSHLRRVEYPAGTRRPDYLDADNYTVYQDADGAVLRLFADTPASGETVRITYTAAHVVDGSGSTIAASDEDALADLAASYLCERISAYYAQSTNASFLVDSTNHVSQAGEYALRAKRFRDLALDSLGIGGKAGEGAQVAAAAVIRDFDSTRLDRSVRLTHPQT